MISDPGYKLVKHCIKENIFITTIPGPSSIICALQLSGLPVNEFIFVGFAPKNKKKMLDFLNSISLEQKTVILLVSSHKIIQLLEMLIETLPSRNVSVCKEITKLNEKTFYGMPENILEKISLNLNENNELFELQFNSSSFEFNSEDLDLKLSEFESRELGISISGNNQGKFFKEQEILMGSFGNDVFIAESRNNEKNEIFETGFLSSPGSDLYIGSKFKNNFVDSLIL